MTAQTNATPSSLPISRREIADILDRLILLEKAFGFRAKKSPLLPFSLRVDCAQIIAVQHAASRIAKYLDLNDLTFVVRIVQQSENVGGKIHLDSKSSLVEIEIDPSLFAFQEAVLATICHEITHRFLFRHGVKEEDTLRNEKLTDTAAVYLGFGYLMTAGSSCFGSSTRRTTSGTATETRTLRTGYLRDIEFAVTNRLVADAHNIPRAEYVRNSPGSALRLERHAESWFPFVFPKTTPGEAVNIHQMQLLEAEIALIQRQDAEVEQRVRSLKMALSDMESSRRTLHLALLEHQRRLTADTLELNQSVAYFRSTKSILEIGELKGSSHLPNLSRLNQAMSALQSNAELPDVLIVACPIDGKQMKVPKGKKLIKVTCPECSYRFLCSTIPPIVGVTPLERSGFRRRLMRRVRKVLGLRAN
jgi:hypothetical protein